ncbi:MAG: hypothetical protein A2750_03540 [Candidatus Yanofskybacteria bacterium RIFCSPHIGHO2_01_FULL_45_42]|uniref:Uncharacterized protein n=3 Tax=Candidatus Yanofskyibacteriota TaxID=1752733 RepID=A0A1F8F2N2_9BACT|nr:MAG: hypothetical protein A2750_03540 [Candidatus Yanofskybacteria bacterium RIFCSPHIGHO2_01_FULL_45_42]OGN16144.1 MAG: hypothetical protein A3C81_01030 [Candidatus Yanofskybacteria bacterium RIFCSPHIGHO2_02_FULL_46_19]OGN26236.1 MAG: hypothetical protein A3B17_02630 [Candidatus Yanofskybacteria bacterium RIFCSPLOWO2_01_FULL_45_72]OGN31798.1 MAG: hypothetical protein A3J01_03345 [Candidatus Yanofskybacteria bacterium RIFCSPLOWO2_02_FULL_45_18]
MGSLFKKSLIVAATTVAVDFAFHYFLTRPMETLTYFVIKFLLAFFVAAALFDSYSFVKNPAVKKYVLAGLIFSTLMSAYYRAWELFEIFAPWGSRAPDIYGISRDNLLFFSGAWWLAHTSFFVLGVILARRWIKN